tara:strand:+ start:470 stop:1795 length:1326 start_codon:yes stop_codon:yes gene_type:complete
MSFPAYPKYKDSGVPWLGNVPTGWTVGRIKDLFEIRKRIAGELGHDVLSITQTGLRVKDVEGNEGQQAMDYSKYQKVLPGEFAMNHMDLLTGWIDIATQAGVTSPDYRVFGARNPEAVDADYFLRVFQMAYSARQFYPFGQGSSQLGRWRLPKDEFYAFPAPIPSLDEQKQIRLFLDRETGKIDALVAAQERLIALLKEKRQAVISHAVTKGLDPDALMKDSGIEWLGEIPAHWDVWKLKGLTSRIGDGLHGTPEYDDDGPCYFINGTNLEDGSIRITEATRSVSSSTAEAHRTALDHSTVLISINGTIGNLALYRGETVILGKSAAYINCCEEIDREFLFYVLQSDSAKHSFRNTIANTTIHNLSLDAIRSLRIGLPVMSEQKQIAESMLDISTQIGDSIDEASKAIDLLKERRAALISAAVTGKINVRGLVEQHEMEAA